MQYSLGEKLASIS